MAEIQAMAMRTMMMMVIIVHHDILEPLPRTPLEELPSMMQITRLLIRVCLPCAVVGSGIMLFLNPKLEIMSPVL